MSRNHGASARRIFSGVIVGIGLIATLLTLAGLLGSFYWLLDVTTHFTIQLALILACCVPAAIYLRVARPLLVGMVAALAVNLLVLGPYFLPARAATAAQGEPLRVATVNTHTDTRDFTRLGAFLRAEALDVVFFVEATPPLISYLRTEFSDAYPVLYDESTNGTLGFAVLSRVPVESIETVPLDGRRRRFIRTQLTWDGQVVTLFGIHPLPALGTRWAERRDAELAQLYRLVAAEPGPLVVLGDFNAAPWSAPMRRWSDLPLRNAARGFGIAPTWYVGTPLLSAPLDYILISPHWTVSDHRLGPDVGSDHWPVVAELGLRAGR